MSFFFQTAGNDSTQLSRRQLSFLALSFLFCLALTFALYSSTLQVGFLLDDFVHLDYSTNANNGDFSGLVKTFSGNWSGQADGLTSFRPGISLSYVADHFLYRLNPVGYHATNLLVFALCSFFCATLAYQLLDSDSFKQRAATAFAAALLFLVFPLHVESVSWIVGRVDLFCTVFYLASLSLYFRFRKTGQFGYFALSLIAFFLSLISKEMAVTLPAVIAMAEILLPDSLGWCKLSIKRRAAYFASYMALLAGFAVLRTALLGTLVGGYGGGNIRDFIHNLRRFLDIATLRKILFGTNEEQTLSPVFAQIAYASWLVVLLCAIVRMFQPLKRLRILAFVAAWAVISVLPTFQIWQISPNLVGSRLFFLGSAGLCILLALIMVPTVKQTAKSGGSKLLSILQSRPMHILGCGALVSLAVTWCVALHHNLYPWVDAGKQMKVLSSRLVELAKNDQVESVVLINLPQDFQGSGMVGSEEILHRMLKPPVTEADYSKKFSKLKEPPVAEPGTIDYAFLKQAYETNRKAHWLFWATGEKRWIDWTIPGGASTFASRDFVTLKKKNLVACQNIENPRYDRIVWAKLKEPINPFAVAAIELKFDGQINDADMSKKVQLLWRSEHQPQNNWIDYCEGPSRQLSEKSAAESPGNSSHSIVFRPNNYRDWLLNGKVVDLGFKLPPGSYNIRLLELKSEDLGLSPGR